MANYIQDPNDSKKQVPGAPPDNAFDRGSVPAACSFSKAPSAVVFNATNGTIGFFLGSSASFSTKSTSEGTPKALSGSQHYVSFGTPAEGTTLQIHPCAWSGSATDSVTFIYKGGLDGGGA